MKKPLILAFLAGTAIFISSCKITPEKDEDDDDKKFGLTRVKEANAEEEDEGYDGAAARYQFELEQVKDPALGYVPVERLVKAIDYTVAQKKYFRAMRTTGALSWTERGPVYDNVGAYGNSRGGVTNYTSGRTRAVLIDTLNDPTGNTVFCGGVDGGLWKCTNFISGAVPNWFFIDDHFSNLAISSICQDPSNPLTMYFSTGEPYDNVDAVIGAGIWKSTDGGTTWTRLPSATAQNFRKVFKLICDAAGDLYVANRATTFGAASNGDGIWRSKDGGTTWTDITPAIRTSTNAACTDLEFTNNGRLHAAFGYSSSGTSTVQHQYTDNPVTVTSALGWTPSVGIRLSATTAHRLELAALADTMYAVTTNASNNVDSCYKSVNGGVTWSIQNSTAYTSGLGSTQGWYALTLAINPFNASQFLVGGLDAYKSTNSGLTISRQTYWVNALPYVHADHHFMQWWKVGAQSRVVIGSDGGLFLSNDGGANFVDRNQNLAIKQFYSCAFHPDAGSNYMLAGAQDNGVHQFTQAGKSFTTEVTGGDGCLVHINQSNPQIQFGSYVYNTYHRSTDGGNTWSTVNFSQSFGYFVNPWDYDDGKDILYASYANMSAANNRILRWKNTTLSTDTTILTLSALTRTSNSNATAFKVSPFTKDRVFIGSSRGKVLRLDNASTVTSANVDANVTDISSALFPVANLNCINTGSSDNALVATFTNYGVSHVWVSTDGGSNWTNISGNLPDMPVRWAVFDPQNDNKMYLATEAGVYYTNAINGGSTVWVSDPNFPTVRTDMLQIRASDNTILAATHGRGLWTASLPVPTPEIRFSASAALYTESTSGTTGCRSYKDYTITVPILKAPSGDATVAYNVMAGNTAVEGVDFDYTTNGNFTSISHQHVFQSGSTASKTLTIRVYNDAEVESDETFTIQASVSGSTDATTGAYATFNVTLKDDDFSPVPVNASIAVGSFNKNITGYVGGSGDFASAFESDRTRHRMQLIYTASELRAAGFSGATPINALTVRVVTKNSTKPFKGFTVSVGNSAAQNLNSGFANETLTQVFSGDYTSQVGDNTFNFSSPFVWNGVSNIVVQFCFDNVPGAADASADVMEGTNSPLGSDYATAMSDNTVYDNNSGGCSLDVMYVNNVRIRAIFSIGNPVASALNTTRTEDIFANKDYYFYSTSNILNRLNATSDLGCVTTNILESGNTWQAFLSGQRSQKVFTITPTINAATTYTVSLYYSAAELSTYSSTPANLRIAKTSSPTMAGANASNTITAPTTFTAFGSGYLFTATFNGFSNFFLVNNNVALPVGILSFDGRLAGDAALLNWSTSSEQDIKNFAVEKSTDGVNFYTIGLVKAAGNSSVKKDYAFRDEQLSAANYYRLQLNDNSGNSKLSNVVLITYSSSKQQVWVVNNPFKDFLDIRFAQAGTKATLQLVYANGTMLTEKQITNVSAGAQVHWQLPATLSAGTYILRTIVDDKVFANKLIKQ